MSEGGMADTQGFQRGRKARLSCQWEICRSAWQKGRRGLILLGMTIQPITSAKHYTQPECWSCPVALYDKVGYLMLVSHSTFKREYRCGQSGSGVCAPTEGC